jgi:hypothetical protein
MFSPAAHAQSDWIDEFPSVTAVALAAYAELKVTSERDKLDMTHDDDSIAVNLAGTFVVLRQIMFLKYTAEPSMSKEREDKLAEVLAAYEEAELAIGKGAPGRHGYITRGPPTGQDCRDLECYRRWFLLHLNAHTSRAEYRERVVKRLFPCGDRAKELNDLSQRNALTIPYFPSPAVTLRVEPELAQLAPAGCATYGGDANQNGLCDDWERPLDGGRAAVASGSTCAPIVLEKVRMASGNGLIVTLAKNSGKLGETASFRVSRSSGPAMDANAQQVWTGETKIQPGTRPDGPLQVILAQDTSFRIDPTSSGPNMDKPWLIVEVTSDRSSAPVGCARPLPITDLSRERTHNGVGLFGPYPDVGKAIYPAGFKALVLTGKPGESGYVILRRDPATGPLVFYATAPVPATQPTSAGKQPKFLAEDYRASIKGSFEKSCEDLENFALIGTVHTHPSEWVELPSNDNFSLNDFNQGIKIGRTAASDFGGGVVIRHAAVRGIFLIPMGTLRILMFIAKADDPLFTDDELDRGSLSTFFSDTYDRYKQRQQEIGRYPESLKN